MRPKPGGRAELARLASEQAEAFRDIPDRWFIAGDFRPTAREMETEDAREARLGRASSALGDHLEPPDDASDLRKSWNVSEIGRDPSFPPRVRLQAYRTFLPEDIPAQLDRWKDWISAVARKEYGAYQLELLVHEESVYLHHHHWAYLQETARTTLDRTAAWANRPEIRAVGDRILAHPAPTIHPAPLWPVWGARACPEDHEGLATFLRESAELLDLNRAWNRLAKGRAKFRCWRGYVTFDEDCQSAASPRTREFFDWAGRCSEAGMVLFLTY